MPAGVSWGVYLRFTIAAMAAMMAGSQVVHKLYDPLKDLDDLVEMEKKRILEAVEKSKEAKTRELDT